MALLPKFCLYFANPVNTLKTLPVLVIGKFSLHFVHSAYFTNSLCTLPVLCKLCLYFCNLYFVKAACIFVPLYFILYMLKLFHFTCVLLEKNYKGQNRPIKASIPNSLHFYLQSWLAPRRTESQ